MKNGLILCSVFVVDKILVQFESLPNIFDIPYPFAYFNNSMGANTSNVAGSSKALKPKEDDDICA